MAEFNHEKYTWSKPFGNARHNWELVCKDGGLNFHVTMGGGFGISAGLEFHHLTGDGAPHRVDCPLTGGRCWHDGTSLYASETLWPHIEPYLKTGDHEKIFKILEREARMHFRMHDEE